MLLLSGFIKAPADEVVDQVLQDGVSERWSKEGRMTCHTF
jgi:hypothetical protein